MLVTEHPIPWTVVTFPIAVLPLLITTIGISLIVAVSNVFFEDTLHLCEVALQALYFLSPILYAREQLPPEVAQWIVLNPIFIQIEFLRDVLFYGNLPDPIMFLGSLLSALLLLTIGLIIFRKAEDKFLYLI